MRWLTNLLRRKSPDALAGLRLEPATEERFALLMEKLEQDRLDALLAGRATLHDLTNVAHGTPGYAINSLEREGLMARVSFERAADGYNRWHYSITPKGLSYLQSVAQNP